MSGALTALNSWSGVWALAVWRACWQGGLVVAAVWLVCRCAPRLPIALRCWLWWVASFRLLITCLWAGPAIPVLPPDAQQHGSTNAKPSDERPRTDEITASAASSSAPSTAARLGRGSAHVPDTIASRVAHTARAETLPSTPSVLMLLWFTAFAALLLGAAREMRLLRRVRGSSQSLDDTELGREIRQMGIALALTSPPRVLSSPSVTAPLVHGISQPTLILPESLVQTLSLDEMRMLLAHELAHIRRKDLWLSAVPLMAQALFFFFPPAWIAARNWQSAQEAACDAEAVAATSARPSDYADLLIRVASYDTRGGMLYALGATASYHTLRHRLTALKDTVRRSASGFSSAYIGIGIACVLFAVPWVPARAAFATSSASGGTSGKTLSVEYVLTDLGTLGGSESEPSGLNDYGDVCGWSSDAHDKSLRPFVWHNGQMLPIPLDPDAVEGEASAVSDAGVVTGGQIHSNGECTAFSFSVEAGLHNLVDRRSGECLRGTRVANDIGAVAGQAHRRACIFQRGVLSYLEESEESDVYGLNNSGLAVGEVIKRACLWVNGQRQMLPSLGADIIESVATAVSNRGVIVGLEDTDSKHRRSFLVEGGQARDLGSLGGKYTSALGINDSGTVVGYSIPAGETEHHAFVWDAWRGLRDLNDLAMLPPRWRLAAAGRINSSGQIAGTAEVGGRRRAFLLTPIVQRRVERN